MNTVLLVKTFLIIIQVLFIGRFHLELGKVNGFMEPANTIRKVTNPLVMPIKNLLPSGHFKKVAAIIVAYLITVICLSLFLSKVPVSTKLSISAVMLISTWLTFLQYGMFIYVIGSWIQIPALQRVNAILHSIFQPLLSPIQKILPSFGGLDFSPIAFLFLLSFVADTFAKLVNT